MTTFQKIIHLMEGLLKDPAQYQTEATSFQEKLLRLVNEFADERPPSLDEAVTLLREEFPSIEENVDLIRKGDSLRKIMIEKIFNEATTMEEVDTMKSKIALFEKLISFNNTISQLILNVKGEYKEKDKVPVINSEKGLMDRQGTAQTYLSKLKNGKSK